MIFSQWDDVLEIGKKEADDKLDSILRSMGVNECCTLVYTVNKKIYKILATTYKFISYHCEFFSVRHGRESEGCDVKPR